MAEQRARKSKKNFKKDLVPIGDDTEPIEAPREDVERGNDEDEESLAAEVARARRNPKNPTSREETRTRRFRTSCLPKLVCCLCRRPRCWWTTSNLYFWMTRRERTTLVVAFDYGSRSQEHADTFPILICRDSTYGQSEML